MPAIPPPSQARLRLPFTPRGCRGRAIPVRLPAVGRCRSLSANTRGFRQVSRSPQCRSHPMSVYLACTTASCGDASTLIGSRRWPQFTEIAQPLEECRGDLRALLDERPTLMRQDVIRQNHGRMHVLHGHFEDQVRAATARSQAGAPGCATARRAAMARSSVSRRESSRTGLAR